MKDIPFPHQKDKLLKDVCTFHIGGPARYFTEVRTSHEMQDRIAYAHTHAIPMLILGKGSNCLFDDRGFNGLVIQNKIDTLLIEDNLYRAGSGYSFARLGHQTARSGWSGLEFAAGIPATVGGAIFMNAGANHQETADCLFEVGFVNEKGERIQLKRDELQFGYRSSCFQFSKGAIVEGVFLLKHSDEAKKQQKTILNYRLQTQPYKDHSAGCAFRNPPGFSAGKLIDECGLKGMKIGGAQVSFQHANFIVNLGNATSEDVKSLIIKIKEIVFKKKEIVLEEEIRWIPNE